MALAISFADPWQLEQGFSDNESEAFKQVTWGTHMSNYNDGVAGLGKGYVNAFRAVGNETGSGAPSFSLNEKQAGPLYGMQLGDFYSGSPDHHSGKYSNGAELSIPNGKNAKLTLQNGPVTAELFNASGNVGAPDKITLSRKSKSGVEHRLELTRHRDGSFSATASNGDGSPIASKKTIAGLLGELVPLLEKMKVATPVETKELFELP